MEVESGGAIVTRIWADRKKLTLIAVFALLSCAIFIKFIMHSENVEEFSSLKNETEETQKPKSRIGYAERLLEREGICFDMHVFLVDKKVKKPIQEKNEQDVDKEDIINKTMLSKKYGLSHTSLIGIMLGFLVISVIVAVADVLKVKRAERSNQPSPDSDVSERCSLAEFANMKRARQSSINDPSSSKYTGLSSRKESLGCDSTKGKIESIAHLQGTETPSTPPVSTGKGPFKLLGARPAPLLRRSSFPASLMNEENRRRFSMDSEEDSSPDVGKRRVRIIRIH